MQRATLLDRPLLNRCTRKTRSGFSSQGPDFGIRFLANRVFKFPSAHVEYVERSACHCSAATLRLTLSHVVVVHNDALNNGNRECEAVKRLQFERGIAFTHFRFLENAEAFVIEEDASLADDLGADRFTGGEILIFGDFGFEPLCGIVLLLGIHVLMDNWDMLEYLFTLAEIGPHAAFAAGGVASRHGAARVESQIKHGGIKPENRNVFVWIILEDGEILGIHWPEFT